MDRLEVHKEKNHHKPMKKGVKITIVSIVCVLAIAAFVVLAHPVYISDGSPAKIAESYLEKQFQLDEYKVENAQIVLYDNIRYIYASYSVKPKEKFFNEWIAGNGDQGDDGWVVNKSSFIACYKIGNIYFTGLTANTGL